MGVGLRRRGISAVRRGAAGVSDSFNRGDSPSSLGVADTGQMWTALTGIWGISSNQAYAVGGTDGALATVPVGTANQDLSVTLPAAPVGATSYPGLIARVTDANTHYLAHANSISGYDIYKCVGGTYTLLSTGNVGVAAGDVLRFVVTGTSLTVYRNGVVVNAITDSSIASGTLAGLRNGASGNYSGNRWDNFSAVAA